MEAAFHWRWCHERRWFSNTVDISSTIEERLASHLDRVNIDEVVREGILLRRLTTPPPPPPPPPPPIARRRTAALTSANRLSAHSR